jgi:hypothetical protein
MPALLNLRQRIAERQTRAIIKALAGVLLHRAQDVLCVLAALIFVEQGYDLAHHHLRRIVAKLLGDRDEPHAVLGELAHIHFEAEGVAKEAREGMDDDHVDRAIVVAGSFDHALKFRPMVVYGRGARLDIFGDDAPALPCAIGGRLRLLIRNGEIDFRLPRRRDPKIEGGADGVGHEKLHNSLPGPEKRVEHVCEKGRQHIHLGGKDRDILRPIIDDKVIRASGFNRSRIISFRRANAIAISVLFSDNSTT